MTTYHRLHKWESDADEMSFERIGWIYAVHHDDGAVAYVGKTVQTPLIRLCGHVAAVDTSRTPFSAWLRKQIRSGRLPAVTGLEACRFDRLLAREKHWIQRHLSDRLLNIAGAPGRTSARILNSPLHKRHVAWMRRFSQPLEGK